MRDCPPFPFTEEESLACARAGLELAKKDWIQGMRSDIPLLQNIADNSADRHGDWRRPLSETRITLELVFRKRIPRMTDPREDARQLIREATECLSVA